MAIILGILKVLITILIILLSALVLLLLIPSKYFINGKINDSIQAKAEIRCVLGLLKITICQYGKKSYLKIIFFGFNVYTKNLISKSNTQRCNKTNRLKNDIKKLDIKFLRYLKDIYNIVKPSNFKLYGSYGFEDPSLTGIILGGISVIRRVIPNAEIYVNPVFERKNVNINIEICGDVHFNLIFYKTLKLFIKKS